MNKSNQQSDDWKEIVTQLRDIAIEKGITQDMIAYKSGMLQSSVSRIFALQFIPKLSTIISIAKALEVDVIVSGCPKEELYKGIRLSKINPEGHKKAIDYFSGSEWDKQVEK